MGNIAACISLDINGIDEGEGDFQEEEKLESKIKITKDIIQAS